MAGVSTRAAALPPEERRAAIIDTTLPLLIEHGPGVTTRQIAEAAGIAEGTIFRVFPDKESLIDAVVERALDPEPAATAIRSIDPSLPIEDRLTAAVEVIQARVAEIWRLFSAVGADKVPDHRSRPGASDPGRGRPPDLTPLAEMFESLGPQIDRDPLVAAQLLQGLAFASSHPMLSRQHVPAHEVVSVILDGIRLHSPAEVLPTAAEA
jgi:AcrR family transcriptional regulator